MKNEFNLDSSLIEEHNSPITGHAFNPSGPPEPAELFCLRGNKEVEYQDWTMVYRLFADLVVLVHFGFVLFVILGVALVYRWKMVAWFHLPAVVWGILIEFMGWICPLTPLEIWLRVMAGQSGYETGFIAHYLLPILYPAALTQSTQIWLGILVLGLNLAIYGWLVHHWMKVEKKRSLANPLNEISS